MTDMFKYATLLILYCLMILLNVYEKKPSDLWNQLTLDKINKTVQMKCLDL